MQRKKCLTIIVQWKHKEGMKKNKRQQDEIGIFVIYYERVTHIEE